MDKFFEAVKILEVWLQANGFWLPADGLWVWAVSRLLMVFGCQPMGYGFGLSAVCLWVFGCQPFVYGFWMSA